MSNYDEYKLKYLYILQQMGNTLTEEQILELKELQARYLKVNVGIKTEIKEGEK